MVDKKAHGCIMADGMGLGKTVRMKRLSLRIELTFAAPMHCLDVDPSQAVSRGREDRHSKMYYCLPIKFGWQLGQ